VSIRVRRIKPTAIEAEIISLVLFLNMTPITVGFSQRQMLLQFFQDFSPTGVRYGLNGNLYKFADGSNILRNQINCPDGRAER
jgi:hypothetical protein